MSKAGIGLLVGLIVFVVASLYFLSSVITPFAVAAVLAYLGDPLVNRLQAWKLPRTFAVVVVFLGLILLLLLLLLILIPVLERQLLAFINQIPDMLNWVQTELLPYLREKLGIKATFDASQLKLMLSGHMQQVGGFASAFWKTLSSSGLLLIAWVVNFLLVLVVMFYLLRDWHSLLGGIANLLPRRVEPIVKKLFNECDEVLSAFLRGQLMVMLGLGVLYSFGLSLVGLSTSLLIGMLSGLVSIVPYLGFIVGILSASIAALVQFHDVIHVVYVAIVFMVAQSIEGMLLTPLLVGDKIGLHPVAVIFAVLAGGELFGFVGILMALPLAAVIMVFIRYFRDKYIASQLYQAEDSAPPIK